MKAHAILVSPVAQAIASLAELWLWVPGAQSLVVRLAFAEPPQYPEVLAARVARFREAPSG